MTSGYAGIFKYLYDFLTLIVGLLTLVAAGVAAWVAWRQFKMKTRDKLINPSYAVRYARKRQVLERERSPAIGVWQILPQPLLG